MDNSRKIILDLCGGTGSWSRPYAEAGYDVRVITVPNNDVRTYEPPMNVYGILAAPPCTMFSFARTNAKSPRDLKSGMEIVRACLDIIWKQMEVIQETKSKIVPLKFWALENPYHGFLKKFLGKPAFTFDPLEFGDGYQERTALWGNFNEPKKSPTPLTDEEKEKSKTNYTFHTLGVKGEYFGKFDRQTRRSITPRGFSEAFFLYNQ